MTTTSPRFTAFHDARRLASGALVDVALATHAALLADPDARILVFDDRSGRPLDLDLRGTAQEVRARVEAVTGPDADGAGPDEVSAALAPPRGRGRPKLGVVAKEVTLLPRHWAWLAGQRGGVSATLRRLVDQARKAGEHQDAVRRAQDAAFRFMSAMAGDLPGYEEAIRALFAGDGDKLSSETEDWPPDVRAHTLDLAADALRAPSHGGDAG